MAYEEVSRVEIKELLRRWQAGRSLRGFPAPPALSRTTARKYDLAAEQLGLRPEGPEPTEDQLVSLAGMNLVGPRKVPVPTEEALGSWAEHRHHSRSSTAPVAHYYSAVYTRLIAAVY